MTVTVGLLSALVRWGWATTLASVLAFAFCAGFIAAGVLAADGRSALPKVTRIALWSGATVTAAGGVVAVFGVAAVFLLLGLVAISPALPFCMEKRWSAVASARSLAASWA